MKFKYFDYKIIILIITLFLLPTLLLVGFNFQKNKILENKNNIKIDNNINKNIGSINDDDNKKDINFLFFGDIMLGRYVETLSIKNNNYPFEKIDKNIFYNKDIIYGNLEGPIMNPNYKTKYNSTIFSFPKYSADILKNNNLNLVSLANNHMQDYGDNGYNQTQKFLKEKDINFFGDYYNKENLYIKKNINGKDFIFFGFNMINKNFEKNLNENKNYIINKILKLKKENPDSFLITFPHWGNEYKIKSNTIQQSFAHELIDSGVDLIIGSHPHVVQEYEIYKDKYIFYSLGNFIFDQYFSKETQEMIGVELNLNCDEKNICKNKFEIIPIKSKNSQPEIVLDKKEKEEFLNKYFKNIKNEN